MTTITKYVGRLGGSSNGEDKVCPLGTHLTELSGHIDSDQNIRSVCGKCSNGQSISHYCIGNFDLPINWKRTGPWSKINVQHRYPGIRSLDEIIPNTTDTIDVLECPYNNHAVGYNFTGDGIMEAIRFICGPKPAEPVIQVEAPQATTQSTSQSIPTNMIQPEQPSSTNVEPPPSSTPTNVTMPIESSTPTPIPPPSTSIPSNVEQPAIKPSNISPSNISSNIPTETSQPNTEPAPSKPSFFSSLFSSNSQPLTQQPSTSQLTPQSNQQSTPSQPTLSTQQSSSQLNQQLSAQQPMSNKVKFFILFLFLVVVASVVALFARSRKRKEQDLQPIQQR